MKIRAFVVSILILSGMLATAFLVEANQSAQDQPFITEAMQAQSSSLQIKSLIAKMKEQLEKNDDTFPEWIREVENYTNVCPDSASVSLLHSMIAEMYQRYYLWNRWMINQRTDLSGYVPDDIREWTGNLFEEKVRKELNLSLEPALLLQKTPATQYKAILTEGTEANLRPTLYDFLMGRAVEIAPDTTYYHQWEQFRKEEGNLEAWLQVHLSKLQYLRDQQCITNQEYGETLEQLSAEYASQPFSNEIRSAHISYLSSIRWSGSKQQQDSNTQKILRICEEGIRQFPNASGTAKLRNMQIDLTDPFIQVTYPNQLYPGKKLELQIRYRNVPQITVCIYKSLRRPEDAWSNLYGKAKSARGSLVKSFTVSGNLPNNYSELDSTFAFVLDLPLGLYECEVSSSDRKLSNSRCISVSRLATIYRGLDDGRKEVLVTDAESGEPKAGVTVYYYRPQKSNGLAERAGEVRTASNGLAVLPMFKDLQCLRPVWGGDSSTVWTPVYGSYVYQPSKERTEVTLFTDRGLYRPGQNVFVKGIAFVRSAESPHVVPNQQIELSLRNANGQEVSKKSFTTDAFGAFNGEFTLPKEGLNGIYVLSPSVGNACSFRVEEYKRPTFQIEIDPITEELSFGQHVQIKGKATTYSGVSLSNGEVRWRIVRRPFWLRSYMPNPFDHTYEQVAEGKTTVDEQGGFNIDFTPEVVSSNRPEALRALPIAQNYELVATLTDSKGETQETTYTFAVSNVGLVLQIQMPSKMEASEAKAIVKATTINRHPVDVQGNYTLYALSGDPSQQTDYWGNTEYPVAGTVTTGNFDTRNVLDETFFQSLKSGRYRLEIKAKDGKGHEVSANQTFVLYRREDTCPPVFSEMWTVDEAIEVLPGEEARFVLGTSYKDAYLLYELYTSDAKSIHQEWIRLSNENRTFTVPFKAIYGKGLTASFTLVKDGKLWTRQISIRLKQPDRQLKIIPNTFRDHLLPGSQESWTFRILDADSANVSAQVLASMYDASLDQLAPFQWKFYPEQAISLRCPYFRAGSTFQNYSNYNGANTKRYTYTEPRYPQLDWQGALNSAHYVEAYGGIATRGNMLMRSAMATAKMAIVEDAAAVEETLELTESTVEGGTVGVLDSEEIDGSISKPALRTDFAETAFFFPVLVSDDEQGEVAYRFTMPESNTTWKLQMIAHTEDLKQGYLSQEIQTSKPLMVLPNLPRFMRQGDQVTISTQVFNQSEKVITGRVSLELFDPDNDQPVVCLTKSQKPFTLEAHAQTVVQWTVPVPANIHLVGCRIWADSDEGSDGEQHLIPVLSNQLLITESMPFYLFGEGEQQIRIPQEKDSHPFRYTLEISANPIWYAVQALPTLTEPEHENILSWFASYYSNTLATYIAQAHPRIQTVIRQWTAQGGDASTLYSNLEKNAELKTILLEETPWVLAAKNETEQKQRLALLFDLNRASGQREVALQHLLQEQNTNGGWSWFKGFPASRSITLSILKGMSQLVELNAVQYGEKEKEMQIKALNFLDQSIQKEYEQLKQYNRKWQKVKPTQEQIDYLFVRSQYRDIPEWGAAREAIRFYTDQAARYWNDLSLYGKGEVALLMHRNGNQELANQIVAWLRKTATLSDEQGMYWANNRSRNSFFTSPIETHCLLMSVLQKLTPNKSETDRLKQWLLNQKRTQNWESEPATVQAIYILLLTGSDWLNENNVCTVQWGDSSYDTQRGDAGLGYLKETVNQERITPDMQTVTIHKEGNTPAWGAVYNQYFQEIDKVGRQKGQLDVEKRLFVETNSGSGLQLTPVVEGDSLQVGDKVVVRLVVRTDQDMDYVLLKDLRAGCFEPASPLSGTEMREGIWYYRSPKDVSENFFFDHLPQGTFVLEYAVYVTRSGEYAGGISTIQCLYAPEFVSHTEGNRITVR